mgnify:CR=1 FL=1
MRNSRWKRDWNYVKIKGIARTDQLANTNKSVDGSELPSLSTRGACCVSAAKLQPKIGQRRNEDFHHWGYFWKRRTMDHFLPLCWCYHCNKMSIPLDIRLHLTCRLNSTPWCVRKRTIASTLEKAIDIAGLNF